MGTAHSLYSLVLPQNGPSATCSALPLVQPCWPFLNSRTTAWLIPSEPPDTVRWTQSLPLDLRFLRLGFLSSKGERDQPTIVFLDCSNEMVLPFFLSKGQIKHASVTRTGSPQEPCEEGEQGRMGRQTWLVRQLDGRRAGRKELFWDDNQQLQGCEEATHFHLQGSDF